MGNTVASSREHGELIPVAVDNSDLNQVEEKRLLHRYYMSLVCLLVFDYVYSPIFIMELKAAHGRVRRKSLI